MSTGSSSGILSRAVRTIVAVRSSGRRSFNEPLSARPMGERAAETITASGMGKPPAGVTAGRLVSLDEDSCKDACVARHVYLCPLRWADMDSLGHVDNVTYV